MFVVHIGAYPPKALGIGLLQERACARVKLSHGDPKKAKRTQYKHLMTQKVLYARMDSMFELF